MSQRKKLKLKLKKPTNQGQNDLTSQMMTEQEQKMYYTNKKRQDQSRSHRQNLPGKRNLTNKLIQSDNQEELDMKEIKGIQIASLNQSSAQEITQFINKLIAKNKVTSRNAFDIPLIHLEQMQDYRASLNQNTWKRLSSTLENDYKIYGYRVDATHTITYKMVESIARHETNIQQSLGFKREKNQIQNQNPLNQSKKTTTYQNLTSFIDSSLNTAVSKNKMNVDYTKFIQKNQKLINVTHIEAFFSYNPGLERTKRKFDQQGLKALLLNNIPLQNCCQLRLDQNRKNYFTKDNHTKKEHQPRQISKNNQFVFQDQASQLFDKIFTKNLDLNQILSQEAQKQANIFTTIYQLNIKQGKDGKNDFDKFQKLYKILSGEDKQQKKNLLKKKLIEQILQEKQAKQNQNLKSMTLKQQIVSSHNPQIQSHTDKIQDANIQPEQDNQQVIESQTIEKDHYLKQSDSNFAPQQFNKVDPVPQQNRKVQQISQKQEKSPKKQINIEQNTLLNKDFKMHEVNLDNLQNDSSSHHSEHAGKFRNIEEYIKLKQNRVKFQKVKKIQIDQLNSDQLGKKLFNRKYNKRRTDLTSGRQLKQEDFNGRLKQKTINFDKIQAGSFILKRSNVFKKSVAEERTFYQIKNRLKLKIEERKKEMIKQQDGENRKKKHKKITKIFDLPVYQSEKGDINFIDPLDQIDPQTDQITYSSLIKDNFPSFIFHAGDIHKIFERQRQEKKKFLEQRERTNEQHTNKMVQNNPIDHQNPANIQNQKTSQLNSQQRDISYIYDQTGPMRGGNQQIAIRQAKQKVKTIMSRMFQTLQQGNKNSKLSFKQIYQSYYLQQGFISPALCFLTVLHLANQHDLILQGTQDGTDFKIQVEDQNNMNDNQIIQNIIRQEKWQKKQTASLRLNIMQGIQQQCKIQVLVNQIVQDCSKDNLMFKEGVQYMDEQKKCIDQENCKK